MSFSDQEQSTEGGAPIELYTITGSDTFYYTSAAEAYTLDGITYEPAAISRTAPMISGKESSGTITVKFPFNNAFVSRYLGGVPPAPDRISIQQIHTSDATAEATPFWSGSVSSVKFSSKEASVVLLGIMGRLNDMIPSQTFSWMCDHNLYSKQCRVPESSHTYSFSIVGISPDGVTVTLSDQGQADAKLSSDVAYFNGGTFLTGVDGSQRMGVNFTPTSATNTYTLVLLVPVQGLVEGQAITFTAGCDKSVDTCLIRFNNVLNYGGFPFVPTLNPHTTDLRLTKDR
tara:strand:- start:1045 stop:1905 length:861 start_codon:yes stop_codon:yes gene_type:complete